MLHLFLIQKYTRLNWKKCTCYLVKREKKKKEREKKPTQKLIQIPSPGIKRDGKHSYFHNKYLVGLGISAYFFRLVKCLMCENKNPNSDHRT